MTAITFPNSPSSGDTHTAGNGIVYTYDGEKWTSIGTNSAGTWTRSGTTVSLTNSGDVLGAVSFDDDVIIRGDSTNGSGQIQLNCEQNSHGIKIKGPPHSASASYTLTLPNDTGTNGQALVTNGSGTLSYASLAPTANPSFTGNVGIGTSSPNNLLTLNSNTANTAITIQSSDSGDAAIVLGDQSDFSRGRIKYENSTDALAFETNNLQERMRIDSSGNVGVGTSSPAFKLHVNVTTNDPTTGTPAAGSFLQIRGDNATVGTGPSLQLANFSGSKETAWRLSAVQTSGNYGDLTFVNYPGGASYVERMRLNSSGNLGLNTTNPLTHFVISRDGNDNIEMGYSPGGGNHFLQGYNRSTSSYRPISLSGSEIRFGSNGANANESGRFDSSGRMIIGGSGALSSNPIFQVRGYTGQPTGAGWMSINSGNNTPSAHSNMALLSFGTGYGVEGGRIQVAADGSNHTSSSSPGRMEFLTTPTNSQSPLERVRITSAGFFKVTETSNYNDAFGGYHEFRSGNSNWISVNTNAHSTTPYGWYIGYTGSSPNNTGSQFLYCNDTTSARFYVASNGGIYNYSGYNSNLSDEREKKNIEPLDSTWNCLKHWELKKFHYNEDADTEDKRYGVIAQQVAPHCPEVITDWIKREAKEAELDDDGNVVTPAQEEIARIGVKEQQMTWMAIKALQEAQDRIETLEAKVAALEAL